ncbi:Tat pathway signal protein [Sulfurimonas sp.]|uniref:Tat pathway signal protein n=1 Tax=Sulfurimonas sp. TaxID=2022749 RepID=UPI0025F275EC|nr:Tat pathway signal protein [Sulfurimonas sp.]
MLENRRSFIKKALGASALVAASTTIAMASGSKQEASSGGVVVGKSHKKEILYKETQAWDDFYKSSS